MNENKGQAIFLSVIGIATLLVAIVGATFAWFSATVEGNDDASSITVQAMSLANIVFDDGNTFDDVEWLPGQSETKTFTVSRTGASANQNFTVSLAYSNVAGTGGSNISDLVYTLTKTRYTVAGGVSTQDTGFGTGGVETVTPQAILSTTPTTITIDTETFSETDATTNEVYVYSLTVSFPETGSDQNAQQGATFTGLIQVAVDGGATTYYNYDNPTGTETMPNAQ